MPPHRPPLNTCCAPVETAIRPQHMCLGKFVHTYGPIFTPVQKDWLKDHIPQYMQWPPTSDETITLIQTMIIDFDRMWPLHQKLWPGLNIHILLSDSMRAKLMAEMLILRAKWFWYWALGKLKKLVAISQIPWKSSSISWTSDPAGLWSIYSGLCLSLDDQKALSQALDIGTDTGTDGDTSNDNITFRIGLALPLAAPKQHLAALPAVSDDPPATTIDSLREAAPVASLAQLLPLVLAPAPTSAPATAQCCCSHCGSCRKWDATGPKVLSVSRAIYHKVDSIEQGINIMKGAIDRGDASQAL
ncbi:uncharacterized protein EDB91DRAFT_1088814 [Suillus paluster]|uniref:uncharacterized protein n=1 Tax=Suillus paluster TaxID=48578 RepID=UPI001B86C737|nr:uncharacterized protein EDB91DRAFT_1088814 [Suillus paluster]KAG1720512.1 hypothetical protein EDB91DRAFT_1088814 [Suillus paluster]